MKLGKPNTPQSELDSASLGYKNIHANFIGKH